MFRQKIIEKNIPGIGPVTFSRSRKAKRMSLSIRPFKGIRVSVPFRISFREAEIFLVSRSDWIKRHNNKLKQFEKEQVRKLEKAPPVNGKEAKEKILARLEKFSDNYGFNYNKVQFRKQRTRWGSCSSKDNLSLNLKMAGLPEELIDYILLHELVHTKYKNHSKFFWNELGKYVDDPIKKRKELREYSYLLIN